MNSQDECQKLTVALIDFLSLSCSSFLLESDVNVYREIDLTSEWKNERELKDVGSEDNRMQGLEPNRSSSNKLFVEDVGDLSKNSNNFLEISEDNGIAELRTSPIEDSSKKKTLIEVVEEKPTKMVDSVSSIATLLDLFKFLSWNISNV